MIGSHDTFTYLEPCNPILNLGERWWKTQCRSIKEQYEFGVRFFDIRVCLDKHYFWRFCHGLVNFNRCVGTLYEICLYMAIFCPKAIYRIVLEKGNYTDEMIFIYETEGLCDKFPNLWRVDIKSSKVWMGEVCNNNELLFNMGYKFALVNTWEKPAHELHGFVTTSNFYKVNLRKEAMKINGSLTFFDNKASLKEVIDDKVNLYFIDYCTNEY